MKAVVLLSLLLVSSVCFLAVVNAEPIPKVDQGIADQTSIGSQTDSEASLREEAALNPDGFSASELRAMHNKEEKYQFQAEVNRLMDIIINSLYSNREIFLRELISNASDALDKIRFLALTNKELLGEGEQANLDIHINFNKDAKTLTLIDRGIGMTKEHLIKHLGVVASSGTTQFVEAVSKGADSLSLIGQFGVGFYSVYLVADRVTVVSKHPEDKQYVWSSTANSTFSVYEDPRGNTLGRGTSVTLHLKDDAVEYLSQDSLERVTTKYSQFIQYPIYLNVTKTVTEEVPAETEADTTEDKEDEDVSVKDEKEEEKPKTKSVSKEVWEWKQVNENKAIWTRKPSSVTAEEYQAFYRTITKDTNDALAWSHFSAEGEISFKSILFIPKTAPFDLYDKFYSKSNALKLYVRRVLISDEFEDLMPRYLNFIKGVVDSDDLPLNVSRETLSKSKVLRVMAKKLVRKALEMLKKLADESAGKKVKDEDDEEQEEAPEEKEKEKEAAETSSEEPKEDKYSQFFQQYGKSIKLGYIEDNANRSKLAKLLRFVTSKSDGKFISLQTYLNNAKESQKYIYYITGESIDQVVNSPFLEQLKKRDIEVLYMVDPLDEYLMNHMTEYESKKFMSVSKEGFKLDESEDEKTREKILKEKFSDLAAWMKTVYGDKVEKVVVSNRIRSSPCVLVTGQYGWSANMERIMKKQAFANKDQQQYMVSKKTLEINPRHPLIKELKARSEQNPDDSELKDMANLLYDSALLNSGFDMASPTDFASRVYRVMAKNMNIDPKLEFDEDEKIEVSQDSEPANNEAEELLNDAQTVDLDSLQDQDRKDDL